MADEQPVVEKGIRCSRTLPDGTEELGVIDTESRTYKVSIVEQKGDVCMVEVEGSNRRLLVYFNQLKKVE